MIYQRPQAILFDLDNTLIPTDELRQRLSERTLRKMGCKVWEGCCAGLLGMTQGEANEWLRENFNIDPLKFRELRNPHEKAAIDNGELQLYPGAYELLRNLDMPWAIVTQSPRSKVKELFDAGIFRGLYPHTIIAAEDCVNSKPHPEPYQAACKKLWTAPQNTYAIEDNFKGASSAIQAGCKTIWFDSGFASGVERLPVILKINSYESLARIL